MNVYQITWGDKTEDVTANTMAEAIKAFCRMNGVDDIRNVSAHRIQTDVPVIDCVNHG